MDEKSKIRAVVVTASDTRSEADDVSGVTLVGLLIAFGAEVHEKVIVSDDFEEIRQTLFALSERDDVDLILTTGGTGFAPRDVTPEATRAVIERETPGLSEAMRSQTASANPKAVLSRGVSGIRGRTLIINLPGSPKGAAECFEVIRPILAHAVSLVRGEKSH